MTYTYNVNGLEATRTSPGGAHTDTTRDNSGRPIRITAKTGTGTTAVDIGYSYTIAGADRTAVARFLRVLALLVGVVMTGIVVVCLVRAGWTPLLCRRASRRACSW